MIDPKEEADKLWSMAATVPHLQEGVEDLIRRVREDEAYAIMRAIENIPGIPGIMLFRSDVFGAIDDARGKK